MLGAAAGVARRLRASAHAAWRPRLAVTRGADPDRVARGEPAQHDADRPQHRPAAARRPWSPRTGAATATVPVPLLRLRPGRDTDGPLRRCRPTAGAWCRSGRCGSPGATRSGWSRWPAPYGGTAPVWVHPRIHPLQRGARPASARSLDGRVDRVPHGVDHLRLAARVRGRRRAAPRALAHQRPGRRADGARERRHQPAPARGAAGRPGRRAPASGSAGRRSRSRRLRGGRVGRRRRGPRGPAGDAAAGR